MKAIAILSVGVMGLGLAAGMTQAAAPGRGDRPAAARGTRDGAPAVARGDAAAGARAAANRAGAAERVAARGARDGAAGGDVALKRAGRGDAPVSGRAGAGDKVAARGGDVKKDGPAAGRGEGAATRAAAVVDKREANQQRRIEQGIKKDQLTEDEVTKLQGLETNIDTLEGTFKSDGKLNKDEVKQLRTALNEASLQIWAERHDTEGNQKPAVRLGKEIFATDALTAKIESGDLTKAEAKAFLADFHKLVNIKRRLATDDLTAGQRTELQAKYNELLNKYFITK